MALPQPENDYEIEFPHDFLSFLPSGPVVDVRPSRSLENFSRHPRASSPVQLLQPLPDESLPEITLQSKEALKDARAASAAEHNATSWQSLLDSREAVFWSAMISMSIVMEGYGTILIVNFFGYPAFQRSFGIYHSEVGYQLTGAWQVGLSNANAVGTIVGIFFNGWAAARFGYRQVMMISLAFLNACIFMTFFAPNVQVLFVSLLLSGLTWGVFNVIAPAYASEVCPLVLRGYLTTYVNLCWAIGHLIAAGVLSGLLHLDNEWSYRIPFALQWIWPLPLMVVCYFAPESPWYFLRTERLKEARNSLARLSNKTSDEIEGTISQMVHTIKIEHQVQSGTSYLDCLRGVDLRRTEICCVTFAGQLLSGATFAYGPTYFFEQAGMSPTNSYKLNVGATAIGFCGTLISLFLLARLGRRILYLGGMATLTATLLIIGIVSVSSNSQAGLWVQSGFTVFWLFIYSLTVGPICYCIISETSSIRLRAKTVCLAQITYQIVNFISGVLEPYMMNPTEWNWKGKTAFFWAATGFSVTVWAYFRLPEGRDRTYEELDIMFAKKISARKFAEFQVDAYAAQAGSSEMELMRTR